MRSRLPVNERMIHASIRHLSEDQDVLVTRVTWGFLVDGARMVGADRVRVLFEDAQTVEDITRIRDNAFVPTGMRDEYESMAVTGAKPWTSRQLRDVSIWRRRVPLVEMFETWDTFLVAEEMAPQKMHRDLTALLWSDHDIMVTDSQRQD